MLLGSAECDPLIFLFTQPTHGADLIIRSLHAPWPLPCCILDSRQHV
jgi:hypothetical protein